MRTALIIFVASIPTLSQAQATFSFNDPTAKWHVAETFPHGSPEFPNFIETSTRLYEFGGTEIFDGESWLSLYSKTYPDVASVLEGWIRTDQELVLFRDTTAAMDTLYNFGLQVGDPVGYELYPGELIFVELLTIDTIYINGEAVRRFHFEQGVDAPAFFNEVWMEGIGSIHGPLFPARPRSFSTEIPADSLMLTCYHLDDSLIWQHPGYDECETNIILDLESHHLDHISFSVYPNPGSDQMNITWNSSDRSPKQIEIYSMLGELLRSEAATTSPIAIAVDDLPFGCYSIHLIDDRGRSTTKWMKE